jgi:regulatory protein
MYRKSLNNEQALQKLRHFCRYQERCSNEVRTKLHELGISKPEHEEMVQKLAGENFINDERFAEAFASGRFRVKQWGKRKIRYALKEKKIDEEIIIKALAGLDAEEYSAVLEKLAFEKFDSLAEEGPAARKKKTIDFLLQKGYEVEFILPTLERAARRQSSAI